MRQPLATLLLGTALGGCSLLYNPSNIPEQMDAPPDQPFDAPIDGNASALMLTTAQPATLYEGTGTGNSRRAVLVVQGMNIVKANTRVTVAPSAGETKTPMLTIDNASLDVSADSTVLAVPVMLPVDKTGLLATDKVKLDITVTQDGPSGPISKTLTKAIQVQGLAELDGAFPTTALPTGSENLYSEVDLTTAGTAGLTGAAGSDPLQIRSTGKLSIKSTNAAPLAIDVSGSVNNPGPGGFAGGAGGSTITPSKMGMGPAGGAASGGDAGFIADPTVYTLDVPFRGSGGGGGQGAATTGSAGGGGGGSVMLTAGGDLDVSNVLAHAGTPASNLNVGGGGSGGVIVLRAGHDLHAGTLDVAGTVSAAAGKVRYDVGGTATGVPGSAFEGPMFVEPPLIVTTDQPTLMIAGKSLTTYKYFVESANGAMVLGPFTFNVPNGGPAPVQLGLGQDQLFPGISRICLVAGAGDASTATQNCIEVALTKH